MLNMPKILDLFLLGVSS